MGYCTRDQLLTSIRRIESAESQATLDLLDQVIDQASAYIDNYTNNFFITKNISTKITGGRLAEVDDVLFSWCNFGYSGSPSYSTLFTSSPILTINYIKLDSVALIDGVDFFLNKNSIDFLAYINSKNKNVDIDADFGYSSVPVDIQTACVMIAGAMSGMNVHAMTGSDGTVVEILRDKIPDYAHDLLKKYKNYTL